MDFSILDNEAERLRAIDDYQIIDWPGQHGHREGSLDHLSLSDPYSTRPRRRQEWTEDGRYVVILPSDELDPAVNATDHHSGGQGVRWPATPYEYLDIPVL